MWGGNWPPKEDPPEYMVQVNTEDDVSVTGNGVGANQVPEAESTICADAAFCIIAVSFPNAIDKVIVVPDAMYVGSALSTMFTSARLLAPPTFITPVMFVDPIEYCNVVPDTHGKVAIGDSPTLAWHVPDGGVSMVGVGADI